MKNLIIFLLLMCPLTMLAQQGYRMAGVIVDNSGETLSGVSIHLKNRPGISTVSDLKGKFEIKASKGDVIVASFLGYDKVELLLDKEDRNLKITLTETSQQMDEFVVTGLGRQRKISVVGAVSSVDVQELQVPAASLANVMGGRVPGVITMQTSGEPGKNISEFWIRGIGTFGANSSALVLIDGLEGDLNTIDAADIESFSVLKDASATAVYGVRGANGVVLVTTKRGISEKLKITARANFTLSNLNKMPEYVGAYDYAKLANEARVVRDDEPLYSDMEMDIIKYGLDPDLYPNVNWQDEIMKKQGFKQTYYVSGQGGGKFARYFISLGLSNEGAAYKVDKSSKYKSDVAYNTYNYRTNLDLNLTKTTSLYFGVEGYVSIKNSPGLANTDDLWAAQSQLTPLTIPLMYSTGEVPAYGANNNYSPYVMLNETGSSSNQTYTGMVTLALKQDLSFLLKGLNFKVQGALDNKTYFNERRYVLPEMYYATGRSVDGKLLLAKSVEAVAAQYSYYQRQYRKYHFETTLNYEKLIADNHRLTALVYYYMSDSKDTYDIDNNGIMDRSMAAIPKRYQGLSSRLTYGFKDTYMVDFNFGYTGSENFQPGRRFGFFPSIALGWVPTQYEWIREKLPWLDFFKIRGSYGSVGNDRISSTRFPYLTLVNENYSGGWASGTGGITETVIGASNLQWEKAIKSDLGIEGRLLKERLSFVVDFFNDARDGIFQKRATIPAFVGLVDMPYGNVGKMRSYGSDGNISFTQKLNKDMSFTIRGNFTYSRSEVTNWEQADTKYDYQKYTDYPYNVTRGYIASGLFRDEQDVASSAVQSFGTKCLPGDIKYKDVNGDGQINTDDMVPLSNSTYPRLMYGFGGELKYKDFTLGVLFKGTGNTDFYYVGQWVSGSQNGMGYVPFYGGNTGQVLSIASDPSNRWIPASYSGDPATENPNARYPRLTYGYNANNSQLSTWWKGNSKYLRLQELTLNYNLKNPLLQRVGINSVDLQLVGSNLFVWDQVDLWDPEQANQNGRAYPIPSTYTLQVYLNF